MSGRDDLYQAGVELGRQLAAEPRAIRAKLERSARAEVTHPDWNAGLDDGLAEAPEAGQALPEAPRKQPGASGSRAKPEATSGASGSLRATIIVGVLAFLAPGAGCVACGLVSGRLMPGTDPALARGAAERWADRAGCEIRIAGRPCLGWQCYTVRCGGPGGYSAEIRCSEAACAQTRRLTR